MKKDIKVILNESNLDNDVVISKAKTIHGDDLDGIKVLIIDDSISTISRCGDMVVAVREEDISSAEKAPLVNTTYVVDTDDNIINLIKQDGSAGAEIEIALRDDGARFFIASDKETLNPKMSLLIGSFDELAKVLIASYDLGEVSCEILIGHPSRVHTESIGHFDKDTGVITPNSERVASLSSNKHILSDGLNFDYTKFSIASDGNLSDDKKTFINGWESTVNVVGVGQEMERTMSITIHSDDESMKLLDKKDVMSFGWTKYNEAKYYEINGEQVPANIFDDQESKYRIRVSENEDEHYVNIYAAEKIDKKWTPIDLNSFSANAFEFLGTEKELSGFIKDWSNDVENGEIRFHNIPIGTIIDRDMKFGSDNLFIINKRPTFIRDIHKPFKYRTVGQEACGEDSPAGSKYGCQADWADFNIVVDFNLIKQFKVVPIGNAGGNNSNSFEIPEFEITKINDITLQVNIPYELKDLDYHLEIYVENQEV